MIDARGLSCPQPVILVKNEVERTGKAAESYEVLVDSRVCVENVSRYAASIGYTADCRKEGEDFRLTLKRK